MRKLLVSCLICFFVGNILHSQPYILDRVVAIIGDFMILQSDIENQYMQYRAQGHDIPDLKCMVLKELMEEKLLLDQAKIDSIEVPDATVELELDRRMQYFINMIGSREDLEEYFNKSIIEIKADFRESVKNQNITNEMQRKIIDDPRVTPSEVRAFFNKIPVDSLPFIDAQVEIQQIVLFPVLSDQAVFEVKERLLDLRRRIIEGESFEPLAILYSEDGSSTEGGEIGFSSKSDLDKEYAKVAFSLKEGQVSKIVESAFGFHLIQLIARRDEQVNTRHILMKPTVTSDARSKAISRLDSIINLIKADSMTFTLASRLYSEDEDTRLSGGLLVNPHTNSSNFEYNQLDTKDYLIVRDMNIGDISEPYETVNKNGKVIYKVIMLKSRIEPHRANLKLDYPLFQNAALQEKRRMIIENWIIDKQEETYIRIEDSLHSCEFLKNGWLVR